MANEIKVTASATNSNFTDDWRPASLTDSQTTKGASGGVVLVGFAAEEDLTLGDVSSPGWFMLRNLDDTNFVTWGAKDTTMKAVGKLEAGEFAILKLDPAVTIRWQADTADVRVEYKCWEV